MPSFINGPASPLALLLEANQTSRPALYWVSGSKGSGKTRWCESAVALAGERSWTISGLLSPAVRQNGKKTGIDLMDVSSGERRQLASRAGWGAREAGDLSSDTFLAGEWRFYADTLAWGNRILGQAISAEFLVIDELGPLELCLGRGLRAGLARIDGRQYRLACVTIRPSLLRFAQERWPWGRILAIDDALLVSEDG